MRRWTLTEVCRRLEGEYGDLGWWPAETRFEILVGAVLVQNTAWSNAEQAIANLRARGWLDAQAILAVPPPELAEALRPSGYFNLKQRRLRALCEWFLASGGFAALDELATDQLRSGLLSVWGVGPETADDILLYAFARPVFVVDAYTRRLLGRLGLCDPDTGYEALRAALESRLPPDVSVLQNFHAVIVEHGKRLCRPDPDCGACVLARRCTFGHSRDTFS